MLRQHALELSVTSRVLVLILHAGRPIGVALGESRHALGAQRPGDDVGLGAERVALVQLGPVSATADAERGRARLMPQAEMQCRKAAHRQADDMRLLFTEMIE